MSTILLKQTGIETYSSPKLHNIVTRKGQTLRVNPDVAEYLKSLERFSDNDAQTIPYFKEISENDVKEVTYDFTSARVQAMVASRPRDTDAIAAEAQAPADEEPAAVQTPAVEVERTGSDEEAGGNDDTHQEPTREDLDAELAELAPVLTNEEIATAIEDFTAVYGNLFTGADAENIKARVPQKAEVKEEVKEPEAEEVKTEVKTEAVTKPATKAAPAKKTAPVVRKSQRQA